MTAGGSRRFGKLGQFLAQFNKQTAHSEKWGVSTDNTATFAPDWAGNFLKALLNVDQLVLQTVPYGEDPITAVFDVSGLQNGLRDIAGECNWSF
jgi:squalene cyclase